MRLFAKGLSISDISQAKGLDEKDVQQIVKD
jgi:hypothetical protein